MTQLASPTRRLGWARIYTYPAFSLLLHCTMALGITALALSSTAPATAAQADTTATMASPIQVLVSTPATPLRPGQRLGLNVLFTNSGDEVTLFQRPERLYAQFSSGMQEYSLHLVLAPSQGQAPERLAPKAWDQARYLMEVPATTAAGIAQLQLQMPQALPSYVLVEALNLPSSEAQLTQQTALGTDATGTGEDSPFVEIVPVAESVDEEAQRNLFLDNFYTYEPLYFLFGTDPSNAKFQISFKYRFVDEDSGFAHNHPWLSNFFVAYTQTSFWDLASESAPFRDTNFKPEILYQFNDIRLPSLDDSAYFDFRFGYQHESNGQSDADSRSLNIAYLEPAIHWNVFGGYQLSVAPRLWTYVGATDGNDDIRDFRGRSSLTATLTQDQGFQLEAYARGNPGKGNGSLQLDLSYPISALSFFNLDFYLYGQFFTGYGESLLDYNRKDTRFRLGLGIVR